MGQPERPSDLLFEPTVANICKGRSARAHLGHPSPISRSTHSFPFSLLLVSCFRDAITPAINSRSLLFNRLGSASEGVSSCALHLVARTSHWRRGDTHAASAMFLQSCQRLGGLGVCPQLSHCDPCVSTAHRMHRQVLIAANRKDDAHWCGQGSFSLVFYQHCVFFRRTCRHVACERLSNRICKYGHRYLREFGRIAAHNSIAL